MKKTWKKLLGILLAVVLVLPSLTSIASAIEPAPKLTAEEAVNAAWALWDEINALEESLEAQKLPEKDLVSRLYDFVASQDEVEKIVREEDDQFGFYTTGNVYNIYDRKEEGFKGGNVDGMIEALGDQIETMDITPVGSLKIGVYSPYYGYDGNMTRNYYEAAVGIQEALGDESVVFDYYGNGSQYGEFATVESFKNWSDYGVVLVDSHGTMSGGTSWICSPLMSDYDPIDVTEGRLAISGGGVWITGTFFEKYCELPNTFIYLGICEGMKSRGLCDPLVAAGAGFVAGYSESVTFYYDGLMMPTICEYLVTESPSDPSRFYTAEEACLKAKEIHGPVDTYGDAVLLWAGNNDLVVQQTPVAATGVALDPASVDLYNNNTYKFNVVTTPADANNYTLSWASSNESVATVAEDGTVTVVGEGTATITVTLNDQLESGVFTATATVNGLGNMAVSGISLDPTAIDTYVGAAPVEITAVIAPANASNQNITWTSSDENVATVDNGVVTGVGAGTATITATTEDGGFTATATVNVVTLDDALNAEGNNLSFQNDPTNPWIMDDSDGRVSAVSNIQGQSNGASTISTTVEMTAGQPMTFDWKVNSENNYDWLTFKVNGAQVDRISGTRNWATKTWTAPSDGSYTFSWTYSKDSSVNTGSDCGWVDNVDVSNEPIIPTPTPDLPGEGFVETNEIIPGEQYIIAVDYNGQTMMMSNELDTDTNIRLVGDPAQMSGNAIVGGYSDNHLWTFSSVTGSTIQSVGNGRYCEVVTHNGYAWLGLADSASYNWTWDGNGNMVTDAPNAGQWNHLSYAETATDIDHPAFDLWVYGQPDYLEIKLYKASGDVPPVTPTPTPDVPGDLDEALNVEGGTLTFANDATYPWEVRDNYAVSGNAGVQSSTSTVTTTVELAEGEALFFDWSTSSEANYDKLIFSANGTAVRNISGIVDWTQFYYAAPAAGTYTFTWSYTKDSSVNGNNDEAYLDEVYVGEAPVIEDPNLYAYSVFTNSWITFNSEDPANTTPVGAPETPIFAAEYVDGTVYGYTENGSFFTTDLNNMGALNILGNFGELVVDMAYNYANETMYAIGTSENQEGPRSLYTVNLETGELTLVGALEGAVDTIMTLGITTEGEAYGVSIGVDTFLHTINLETAECEAKDLVTGFPLNYIQTMTYDHNNDRMIWAQYSDDSSNGLVELNLGTGIGTRISGGPVGGQESELTGLFTIPGEGPTPPPPGDYTIEAGTVEANPGSTVRVPVTVNGLAAAAFELSYDADMFTYVGYTNPVSDALVTVNDLVAGELTIAMMNYEANYEGEAIILEFAVAGDCEDGEYAIPVEVISAAAIIDGATTGIDASEVDAIAGAINVVNGYTVTFMYNGEIIAEVTVPVGGAAEAPEMDRYIYDEESGYYHVFCGWDKDFSSVYENMTVNAIYGILGDVNNDGTVNITDATMLMRGVVGMEALSELQEILADVNCDGSVGISDATLIARFVTGLETFPVPMD